ncbi:putative hydrolase isoform X1 [Cinnamomum micranthum f. kanehirae]|uniref:Putative hydrolase isoform X1 n=1 Tax=Cinnamomum micranthum f. kanehirae TaxID=337451 RepID=A0A443PDE8_9MAGN|nr:putative hydrolase isoform X1 [Cinnamomum micranthum f. kanehirae]
MNLHLTKGQGIRSRSHGAVACNIQTASPFLTSGTTFPSKPKSQPFTHHICPHLLTRKYRCDSRGPLPSPSNSTTPARSLLPLSRPLPFLPPSSFLLPLPLSLSLSLSPTAMETACNGENVSENSSFSDPDSKNHPSSSSSSSSSSSLIFLGTGCSGAVPNLTCLLQPSDPPCSVCIQSLSVPPELNPNYRCNTSLLVDYSHADGRHNYILIDVGKTFREQVLRWFTHHKIPRVDSIILTHEHADAVLGLDDIRAVQPYSPTNDIEPTPIYLTQFAMDSNRIRFCSISHIIFRLYYLVYFFPDAFHTSILISIAVKFSYLVKKKLKEGQEVRRVAQLDWKIIEDHSGKPFIASGLQFVPLPVMHGEDYVCLGFLFGEKSRVAYISDISRFIASTENLISKTGDGQLDLLILDTLYKKGSHNTHFCFPQSLDAVKRICPKEALFIGMTHEFDHHKDNEFLAEWSRREGIPVKLAHDGLRIPIDL